MFIQRNLQNIASDLLTVDEDRTYKVEPQELLRILKYRTRLPEYMKNDDTDMQDFVNQHTEEGTVNYKYLLEDL